MFHHAPDVQAPHLELHLLKIAGESYGSKYIFSRIYIQDTTELRSVHLRSALVSSSRLNIITGDHLVGKYNSA